MSNINKNTFIELKKYYDEVLNIDKSTYASTNDEPTPIDCIIEMISKLPEELWKQSDIKILDPCCGNGNFALPIFFKLLQQGHTKEYILENILEFNDINEKRLENVQNIFCRDKYNLNITCDDYLSKQYYHKYDLIVANPPYAKILANGKRASKNHNLIKDFIQKSLALLKPDGYLLFITPDNWMSYADRNTLIERLTYLQIIYLNIHTAKKYFKKIGSSFTWYIIQNCKAYKNICIEGIWKKKNYSSEVISCKQKFIPLLYTATVQNILSKTLHSNHNKFEIKTSSYLHKYTKAKYINTQETDKFKYKLIHTPTQTVYASIPHIYQEGYKVFISTTDKYQVFVDNCGMTQSIVFIMCKNKTEAETYANILQHPLYIFINNICRWGNFNNIRILQSFPIPDCECDHKQIYEYFNITDDEIQYITNNM
jgi:SAM-dependent methyltransferase